MTSRHTASKVIEGMAVHVSIDEFFDAEAEQERLTAEKENLTKFVKSIQGKLSNENFASRAPAEVVQTERDKLTAAEEQLAAIKAALAKL